MIKDIDIDVIEKYFLGQGDVICAYIFGSFAKGKENLYSDLDIALLLDANVSREKYTDIQIAVMNGLSESLNINVDVVILNKANTILKFQVMRDGKRVYEKRDRKNRSFEAHALIEYFDFLPIRNILERGLIRKIKEA